MIALDTNVLVRFLVADEDRQFEAAKAVLARLGPRDEAGFITDVVLAELAWVLRSVYRYSRAETVEALALLAHSHHLAFEDDDRLTRALAAFASGRGDFADYLIRERAKAAGCATVLTFDRDLWKEKGFSAVR